MFPTDYGFVPESFGHDAEDPLDVLVAVSEPTFPGNTEARERFR